MSSLSCKCDMQKHNLVLAHFHTLRTNFLVALSINRLNTSAKIMKRKGERATPLDSIPRTHNLLLGFPWFIKENFLPNEEICIQTTNINSTHLIHLSIGKSNTKSLKQDYRVSHRLLGCRLVRQIC